MDARSVILEPVVSEKSYALMADGKYTFRVDPRAHKTQIALAVEEIFDVGVVDGRRAGVPRKVATIEYDPNRTCYIALLHYADGQKAYILAPQGLAPGDRLESGDAADIRPGNALPLRAIPTGTVVHNVELIPGQGGRMARSAGAAVQVVAKEG